MTSNVALFICLVALLAVQDCYASRRSRASELYKEPRPCLYHIKIDGSSPIVLSRRTYGPECGCSEPVTLQGYHSSQYPSELKLSFPSPAPSCGCAPEAEPSCGCHHEPTHTSCCLPKRKITCSCGTEPYCGPDQRMYYSFVTKSVVSYDSEHPSVCTEPKPTCLPETEPHYVPHPQPCEPEQESSNSCPKSFCGCVPVTECSSCVYHSEP